MLLDDHASLAEAVAAAGGAPYVSLVPTQLVRRSGRRTTRRRSPRCAAVLVGGGPVDRALRERAADGGIRVVATYGSAETCGGCVYDGLPARRRRRGDRRRRADPDRRAHAVRRLRRRPRR